MPIGGFKTPVPPDALAKAKSLYLDQGLGWTQISKLTGIKASTLNTKACLSGWTKLKKQQAEQQKLESVKPKLHAQLTHLISKLPQAKHERALHKPSNQAPVLLQLAQAAKLIEGWSDATAASVVNIALLGSTQEQPVTQQNVIDVEPTTPAEPNDPGL